MLLASPNGKENYVCRLRPFHVLLFVMHLDCFPIIGVLVLFYYIIMCLRTLLSLFVNLLAFRLNIEFGTWKIDP